MCKNIDLCKKLYLCKKLHRNGVIWKGEARKREESGLYVLVGLILAGVFHFPIGFIGTILVIIGFSLVRNNHLCFKAAWVLEILYSLMSLPWAVLNRWYPQRSDVWGTWWWPLDELACLVLFISLYRYYSNSRLKWRRWLRGFWSS